MRWAAFVRNVMVGREGLDREVLLATAREAGAGEVRSHLATGNLSFTVAAEDVPAVVARLEAGVARVLGRHEMVAVRNLAWLRELVRADPFTGLDPAAWELEVAMLAHDAPPLDASRLPDPRRTVLVGVHDRELLTARPRAGGSSPHANQLLQQASGAPATTRAWSTLRRVAEHGR